MSALIRKSTTSAAGAAFSALVRSAFTFDPVASRMLSDTFVNVHLNSRIWMV